jgi:hypothetical protein
MMRRSTLGISLAFLRVLSQHGVDAREDPPVAPNEPEYLRSPFSHGGGGTPFPSGRCVEQENTEVTKCLI